jgi:hypothetical protein
MPEEGGVTDFYLFNFFLKRFSLDTQWACQEK